MRFYRASLLGVIFGTLMFVVSAVGAPKEKAIYSFTGQKDEGFPHSGLVFDHQGNLYGTDCGGGISDYYGTAFRLSRAKSGLWHIVVLHIFTGATDGSCPAASLVLDGKGNLYGTTTGGGNLNFCNGLGCGTVFEISKTANEKWKETVLYKFTDGSDGGFPYTAVTFDALGRLYGTTSRGGSSDEGTAFKLTPTKTGKWKFATIHSFSGADGAYPHGDLILDSEGNIYGTTSQGGRGYGTVYELSPSGKTGWTYSVLYNFTDGSDGGIPLGGVILDSKGNLYGTASNGGAGNGESGNGVVFELSSEGGAWVETVLYAFNDNNDGRYPEAGVIFDSHGSIYGTNYYGGTVDGTVFKLVHGSQGWTETILYSFTGGQDGGEPESGVIFDKSGAVYGTASTGGALGWGCIFKVSP